jgi:hypothetical protein
MALNLTRIDELALVTLDRPKVLNAARSSGGSSVVRE